jgi:hypothetical protein
VSSLQLLKSKRRTTFFAPVVMPQHTPGAANVEVRSERAQAQVHIARVRRQEDLVVVIVVMRDSFPDLSAACRRALRAVRARAKVLHGQVRPDHRILLLAGGRSKNL